VAAPIFACQEIGDPSGIGAARRLTARISGEAALSEKTASTAALISTELATNTLLHGRGGELHVRLLRDGPEGSLELLAVDRGPGMADPALCMRDGYSTAGTPGNGLGAIRRMATLFDLFSAPGKGTAVLARIEGTSSANSFGDSWGAIATNAPGERVCGDSWRVVEDDDGFAVLVADGVGHGFEAHRAAEVVGSLFEAGIPGSLPSFLQRAHEPMKQGRGAAVAVARCSRRGNALTYLGVGNIGGSVIEVSGAQRGLMSHHGTLGSAIRTMHEITSAWQPGALLVMHSDGIKTRWSLDGYHDLRERHPSIIAAVLHRDFRRGNDDATVLVLKRGL
jgi:anti-sigma regulatory factor (Ser/Thr protein kinase)